MRSKIVSLKPGLFRGDSGLSIALGFVALIGAAHVLIRTDMYGIPMFGDTLVYTHFAETFAAGDGFEGRLIQWPPLLSTVLGFFGSLGVEPTESGRYLNIISLGLIILVAGHWLHRYVKCRFLVIGAAVTIMISYPLTRTSSYVLTETLFILITLLALVNIESFLSGRRIKSGLLLPIFFSALAPLTRWLGVTVIFTGVILILTRRDYPTTVRWKHAAFYGTVSLVPLAFWLTRNRMVSGTLTGPRRDMGSDQSYGDSLSQLGEVLHWWTFARQGPGWLGICLWAAAALMALEALRFLISRRTSVAAFQKIEGSDGPRERPILPFAVFAIVYFSVLFLLLPYTTIEGINNRYLSPVYLPTIIVIAIWLDRFILMTYQTSGISVWKSLDGCGIRYNKASGPMAVTRWVLIGSILSIALANNIRNIQLYIDVLITYDPYNYLF